MLEKQCSLILSLLSSVNSITTSTVSKVYTIPDREICSVSVSAKMHFNAGFRLKHIGEVLYASVKNEFEAVVDKCEVVIYTDPAECTRIRHEVAIPTFNKRDDRLRTLTDESVDVYYSCILCQAFSPSHVCVVTPERLDCVVLFHGWMQKLQTSWIQTDHVR